MHISANRVLYALVFAIAASLVAGGCESWSRKSKGAAAGAATGGVVGGVIGHRVGNTAQGAILGAAIGGTAGALIGDYMDRQAAEMQRNVEGAEIERVGEGIKVTFPSGILFDFDSDDLREASRSDLQDFANTLKKYDDTKILVVGHTDATGSEDYNARLSERRADAVADYLEDIGVDGDRLDRVGHGELEPVASNSSEMGRQQNRRVEVAIFANDDLKNAARAGTIESLLPR